MLLGWVPGQLTGWAAHLTGRTPGDLHCPELGVLVKGATAQGCCSNRRRRGEAPTPMTRQRQCNKVSAAQVQPAEEPARAR